MVSSYYTTVVPSRKSRVVVQFDFKLHHYQIAMRPRTTNLFVDLWFFRL